MILPSKLQVQEFSLLLHLNLSLSLSLYNLSCRFKALLCWRPQVPERRAVDKNPIYGEYAVIYQATEVGSGLDQDSVYPRCKTEMWTTMGRLADLPWLSLVTGTHSITQENEKQCLVIIFAIN